MVLHTSVRQRRLFRRIRKRAVIISGFVSGVVIIAIGFIILLGAISLFGAPLQPKSLDQTHKTCFTDRGLICEEFFITTEGVTIVLSNPGKKDMYFNENAISVFTKNGLAKNTILRASLSKNHLKPGESLFLFIPRLQYDSSVVVQQFEIRLPFNNGAGIALEESKVTIFSNLIIV